jgi:hypothetical protein
MRGTTSGLRAGRVAIALLLVLIVLDSGLTRSAHSAFSGATANVSTFASAATFCTASPTAAFVTGFEAGTVPTGTGNWTLQTAGGTPAVDSTVKRNGGYSLKIAKTTGLSYAGKTISSTAPVGVVRFALRFATLPGADVNQLAVLQTTGGNSPAIGYVSASQKLRLRLNGTNALAATPVVAGTWYVLDITADIASNPRTATWRLNGVDSGSVSSAETGAAFSDLRLGSGVNGDTFTANYDDAMVSLTASDYPIGDGKVTALRPNGQGTHAGATGVVVNEDDSNLGASTPARLADDPMTSTAAYVKQTSAGAAAYGELAFADTAESCVNGVQATVAVHASAASGTNNAKALVVSGGTTTTVITNINGTSLKYATSAVTPASSWTPNAVNALVAQVGFATAVSTVPYWDALLLEVDTQA